MKTKEVRDGKVAVLYSPGYGAGWSTWGGGRDDGEENFLLFDPTLVSLVEQDERDRIPAYVKSVYPGVYTGGAKDLQIYWVPEGRLFKVKEYDGYESVEIREEVFYYVA